MNGNCNDIDIGRMSLRQKADLCSGSDFWHFKGVKELGLPEILLADGPHGLKRQQRESAAGEKRQMPSTCFPTSSAIASSWDPCLIERVGRAIGEECRAAGVSVLLGPGVNIKRSPLCGRNYEYYSEDPLLSGLLGAAMIEGIQSVNVGACVKHFACNNQETLRMTINSVVDERALREIYLRPFEIAIKKADPWLVMCSYNRLNGVYTSEHPRLLTGILRDEWGYEGAVVSDWGACDDRVAGIEAGLNFEMPGSCGYNDSRIVEAVEGKRLDAGCLDRIAAENLGLIRKCAASLDAGVHCDTDAHHQLAREAAAESAVLLKNNGILPLGTPGRIAVIGGFAVKPKIQGLGSANLLPEKVDTICGELDLRGIEYVFAEGYRENSKEPDEVLIAEAAEVARAADTVIIVAGLTMAMETEWQDRDSIDLPASHDLLIRRVVEANPASVVLLQNGAPVSMPWIEEAAAVLECYLAGEAGGAAAVDILLGDVNPSGKLAETFPFRTEDNPSYNFFPGGPWNVEYRESIFTGYRYYVTAAKGVLFPFGHGLSYTEFEYYDLEIRRDGELRYSICFKIRNTGNCAGAEVAQLYTGSANSTVFRPAMELQAFNKVFIEPGDTAAVVFRLDEESFRFYNPARGCWQADPGKYRLMIGSSCLDIRLEASVEIETTDDCAVPAYLSKTSPYCFPGRNLTEVNEKEFNALCGDQLDALRFKPRKGFSLNSTIGEAEKKAAGRYFTRIIKKHLVPVITFGNEGLPDSEVEKMADMIPFRMIIMMSGELVSPLVINGIIELLNGKLIKGIKMIRAGGRDAK